MKVPPHTHAQAGFTLLELLVAMFVLVVLMSIVYIAFSSVTDTTILARDEGTRMRTQQYLWRNLSTNLSSVYADPSMVEPDFLLEGVNEDGPSGPADTLRFCTALPMSGARALPGVLRVVTYEAIPESELGEQTAIAGGTTLDALAQDGPERLMLLIREEPLVLAATDFAGEARAEDLDSQSVQEQSVPIRSFNVMFYDGESEEWVEEWDSVAEARMPWAIQVQINFERTEAQLEEDYAAGIDPMESPDLDYVAPLQIGMGALTPFQDLNHQRTSDLENDNLSEDRPAADRKDP